MKEPITKERWLEAQEGEKAFHIVEPLEVSFNHYRDTYANYFKWLDINNDLKGKSVIEIGPGRIAGLLLCDNHKLSYVIEPTEYEGISLFYDAKENLLVIKKTAEEIDLPSVDEVWLFNLMQHVQDPDLLIEKCKKAAKVIRFFEPLDTPINLEHPFTFSMDDFKGYFGDCVKEYAANQDIEGFHGARCAYGIYLTGRD